MNQRLLRIFDDLEAQTTKPVVGNFKGFTELDREARERGFELYPLTRAGTCTALLYDPIRMICRECGDPAICNRACPSTSGWHLKQELNYQGRTNQ